MTARGKGLRRLAATAVAVELTLVGVHTRDSLADEQAADEQAADEQAADEGELFDLSIGELLEVPVALSGRREQDVLAVPAAVYVITPEQIESSGLTTLPELLRLAPGVTVGRIDANKWAISIRGFTSLFASKLLVLMDGRTLYTPLFSGVDWDIQDPFLPDIEQIEVIRGPGGSLWGTNAVNGIINIVTKDAQDTQGVRGYAAAGYDEAEVLAGLRYGGSVGSAFYRIFGKYDRFDSGEVLGPADSPNDGVLPIGSEGPDQWQRGRVGARADIPLGADGRAMIEGSAYAGRYGQARVFSPAPGAPPMVTEGNIETRGANLTTRLRRPVADAGELLVRAFYDYTFRDNDDALVERRHTADIDTQYQQHLGGPDAHLVTVGASYRISADDTEPRLFVLEPAAVTQHIAGAFAQLELAALADVLRVVAGTKVEHNNFSGLELQPSVRALVRPVDELVAWAAVTRAVRVPSRTELHASIEVAPGVIVPIGNSDVDSERALAYELGGRWLPNDDASIDIAAFYQDYDNLFVVDGRNNDGSAYVCGGEAVLNWQVIEQLIVRLHYAYAAGYAADPTNDPAEDDFFHVVGNLPRHQASLRASFRPNTSWAFDVSGYYASDGAERANGNRIDSYLKLDTRIRYDVSSAIGVELVGLNLLDAVRAEDESAQRLNTGVERSVYLRLDLTY